MKTTLFLEDLHVGQKFVSGDYSMDKEQIIAFAQTFDPQIFHVDPVKAEDSFFRGHAASGWHTAAVTMRLIVTSVPIDCGIIGMGGEIAWLKPVRPGDVLHVESEILDIQPGPKPDRGIVTCLVKTKNQQGETVQTFNSKIVVFCKKA